MYVYTPYRNVNNNKYWVENVGIRSDGVPEGRKYIPFDISAAAAVALETLHGTTLKKIFPFFSIIKMRNTRVFFYFLIPSAYQPIQIHTHACTWDRNYNIITKLRRKTH